MRDRASKISIAVENHSVGSGAAAGVDLEAAQNGELVPGAADGEVKALVVAVLVRVVIRTQSLPVLEQAVAFVDGGVDVGLPVAGAAAGFDTGLALDEKVAAGEGVDGSQGHEEASEDLGCALVEGGGDGQWKTHLWELHGQESDTKWMWV
jgi:hypothetical protein